jgi:hypothetical protein
MFRFCLPRFHSSFLMNNRCFFLFFSNGYHLSPLPGVDRVFDDFINLPSNNSFSLNKPILRESEFYVSELTIESLILFEL